MSDAKKKERAVRRLLAAVDRAILACEQAKRARDELTELSDGGSNRGS